MPSQTSVAIIAPPCQLIPSAGYGGIERVAVVRARLFMEMGYDTTIVAPTLDASLADHVIKVRTVGCAPGLTKERAARWVSTLGGSNYLLPYLAQHIPRSIDCVVNDAYRNEPWNAYLLGMKFGFARTINVLHGNFVRLPKIERLLRGAYSRLQFGALNKELFHLMTSRGLSACYFPNGVSIPAGTSVVDEPDLDLVAVGRIDRSKGTDMVVKLAERARRHLTLVGPIKDRAFFASEIAPKIGHSVSYLGEVDRDHLTDCLRRSRALVFASRFPDPQPAVLLEALSFGVPVVALAPPHPSGFYDIVVDGRNGVVESDLDCLVERLDEIDQLPRRAIHEETKREWSWEAIASKYYTSILARSD
jgi:glycosyltransferase involved in cell wall biosynthesis